MGRTRFFPRRCAAACVALLGAAAPAQPPAAQPPAQPPTPLLPRTGQPPAGVIEATKPKPGEQPEAPPKPAREPNPGGYKLERGPVQFTSVPAVTLKDPARKKDLEVRVRYSRLPQDAGPFPVVILSHGAGGSSRAFPELANLIASHGYVVLSPAHADSIRLRHKNKEEMDVDARKELEKLAEKVDPLDRLADIGLVLDSLDVLADNVPNLRNTDGVSKMDPTSVAIIGHSAGAFTAQLAMGVRARIPGKGEALASYGDPRIKAGILISPQSTGSGALTPDSWSSLTIPTLVIAGDQESPGFTKETAETRRQPFDLAPAGNKYLVLIHGATHSSFAGAQAAAVMGEKPETDAGTITDTLASAVLAFLDATLKRDAEAREYLAGDGIGTVSLKKAEILHK